MSRYIAKDMNGWIVVVDKVSGNVVEDGYDNLAQAKRAAKRFNENN